MNQKIRKLEEKMTVDQALIYDKYNIQYFIDEKYDVGERFIALLIQKGKEPILFINKLFNHPKNINTVFFEDHENPLDLVEQYLSNDLIGVDGNMPARFLLPFINKSYKFLDISNCINSIRAIKNKNEIEKLAKASELNDEIMKKVQNLLEVGKSEKEIAESIYKLHEANDPLGVSFTPIVLFSENSADPHGMPSDRKLKEDDYVLVDMGGHYQSYASDMTRCFFPKQGHKMQEIYEIVLQANKAAIKAIRPGSLLSDVDYAARSVIEKHGYKDQFVHRTGHGVGIEVHEVLDVSQSSNTVIKEGMCFSIEPGIYLEGIGGIRIEDLVIVEEDGARILNFFPKCTNYAKW